MSKAPAFQLYASDFYMDTAAWEVDEIGAYIRLLLYEWVNGGIPDDLEQIARIVGIGLPDKNTRYAVKFERKLCDFSVKMKRNVLQKFHMNGNGLLVNSRLELEREKQRQHSELQSEKGKKSAIKRWGEPVTTVITPVTERLQPDCNSSSSSSSSLKEKKYIKKRKITEPDDQWLIKIQTMECYSHLNVKDQLQKCIVWFQAKNITVSRQRFLNWLNNPRYNQKPVKIDNIDPYSHLEVVHGRKN
jgi:uncharacterized protein YdaU (DUF1376 family)